MLDSSNFEKCTRDICIPPRPPPPKWGKEYFPAPPPICLEGYPAPVELEGASNRGNLGLASRSKHNIARGCCQQWVLSLSSGGRAGFELRSPLQEIVPLCFTKHGSMSGQAYGDNSKGPRSPRGGFQYRFRVVNLQDYVLKCARHIPCGSHWTDVHVISHRLECAQHPCARS